MRVLSNEERVKILSDIVSIKTVNSNELEVAQYLENYLIGMEFVHILIQLQMVEQI